MNRTLYASALAILALVWGGSSFAAELGTPEQGKALLDRAVAALKSNEAAALKAFNDEHNKDFRERDLYVFCFNLADGNFTAYESPMLLGVNIRELKLPPNDPIGQRAYDAVANAAEGSFVTIEYQFPKPGTKKNVPKESLETRVGHQGCGVSYFK
jgi:cytochrome c